MQETIRYLSTPLGIYFSWIILHFITPHLYTYFCTSPTVYGSDTALFSISMDNTHEWQHDYCNVDADWWMGNSAITDKIIF
jgi:hypothetical protein